MSRAIAIAGVLISALACEQAPRVHEGGQHERIEERAQEALKAPLAIIVDGKPVAPWTMEQLTRVGDGKGSWSLRDLVRELVGPKARVVAVIASAQRTVAITKSEWGDQTKTPLLRLNRQGELKLQWADLELRGVKTLEISEDR